MDCGFRCALRDDETSQICKNTYPRTQTLMHNRRTVLTGTRIMSRMFVEGGGAGWRALGAFVGDEPYIRASESRFHGTCETGE